MTEWHAAAIVGLLLINFGDPQSISQFGMYKTHQRQMNNDHDCLLYYVSDDIVDYGHEYILQHQIIEYCIRTENSIVSDEHITQEPVQWGHLFTDLRHADIKSEQLFMWSAPIDIIEYYQSGSDTHYFYNCTWPWFGSRCQYRFVEPWHHEKQSLGNVIESIMKATRFFGEKSFPSCYKHLQCGSPCLDWREICDGKIDCIDSGKDEENCTELEMNECTLSGEYRCHNGMQCIPLDFVRDNFLNPDCIDRSDEPYFHSDYPEYCYEDPAFRCEEHTCRPSVFDEVPCGDGQCSRNLYDSRCVNKRGHRFRNDLFQKIMAHGFDDMCLKAMACVTNGDLVACVLNCIRTKTCGKIIQANCPSIPFAFPPSPVLFGHVYFLYTNNQSNFDRQSVLPPNSICFSEYICSDIINSHSTWTMSEGIVCLSLFDILGYPSSYSDWFDLVDHVEMRFRPCSTKYVEVSTCEAHSKLFYLCINSSKCISIHRLVDSRQDCVWNDDETFNNSCELDDKQFRFKCPTHLTTISKCISPIAVENKKPDCDGEEDEPSLMEEISKKGLPFATLCDGFVELLIPNNINETDETDCDWWPCDNMYTRCDGVWNCRNGIDEVNCSYLPMLCPPMQHLCVQPDTLKVICLPIVHAGNGKPDCIGAMDERHLCRSTKTATKSFKPFRCWNCTNCLSLFDICDDDPTCKFEDDERFCSRSVFALCMSTESYETTLVEKIICLLRLEQYKRTVIHFALEHKRVIKKLMFVTEDEDQKTEEQVISDVHRQQTSILQWQQPITRNVEGLFRCNRGLTVQVRDGETKCLCPPAYYGNACQHQSQRVSLTIQVQTEADWRTIFDLAIFLVDEDQASEFHDHIEYLAIRDCITKFNIYLLYASRPKNSTKKYSVRIDAYEKISLILRASWFYPLAFSFLPVHRLAAQISIPFQAPQYSCSLKCVNGQCIPFVNQPVIDIDGFCLCNRGWSGPLCTIKHDRCQCSLDSICIGTGSFCLCPLGKFGPRCFLTQISCHSKTCEYNGQCVTTDERLSSSKSRQAIKSTCICQEGYSGTRCEQIDSKIEILFHSDVPIPSSILAHFITVNSDSNPVRLTTFRKIPMDQDKVTLYVAKIFHILFVEFSTRYYLTVLEKHPTTFATMAAKVIPSRRCLNIAELFNLSVLKYHVMRRIKLYHLTCQHRVELECFHDEAYMCLCDPVRLHANCFEFNHRMTYNCQGSTFCTNGAQCFKDDSICPTASMCVCAECYYGTRCELSTKGFEPSLETILGYQIRPNISFYQQRPAVKVSTAIVILMSIVGIINGIFSILTFQAKKTREVGSGLYLLTTSITSLLTSVVFAFEFLRLLLSQMNLIDHTLFLTSTCFSVNLILRSLLRSSDWFNACVAVERAAVIIKGVNFKKKKSKQIAKWVILSVILLVICTTIHDPFHRRLINDLVEKRTWCIVVYSFSFEAYNSIMHGLCFIVPFMINIISALIIITSKRISAKKTVEFNQHLKNKIQQYKHLIISPCILVLLGVPRLVIGFLAGCMKSTRNPWLYLAGYFLSYIPPALSFAVFVLPSEMYMKEFQQSMKRFSQWLNRLHH